MYAHAAAPAGEFAFDADRAAARWARLHAADAEPLPASRAVLHAWALFHAGRFEEAAAAGLAAGDAGVTVANKAMALHAHHVEPDECRRLALFQQVAERAAAQARRHPRDPAAWYWHGYALGRYSQGISVARALAQGLGPTVKHSFEQTLRLQPAHADAHVALGAFHAEIVHKLGAVVGGLTYGASRRVSLEMFGAGLRIHPDSAIGWIESAQALQRLDGDAADAEVRARLARAADIEPADAAERYSVLHARALLAQTTSGAIPAG